MYRCCITRIGHQEQNCLVKMKAHTCYAHSHTVNVLILTKVTASINTVHIKQITPKHLNGCIDLILFVLLVSNQIKSIFAGPGSLNYQIRCVASYQSTFSCFASLSKSSVKNLDLDFRSSHCI